MARAGGDAKLSRRTREESVLMQKVPYVPETVLSNKITRKDNQGIKYSNHLRTVFQNH